MSKDKDTKLFSVIYNGISSFLRTNAAQTNWGYSSLYLGEMWKRTKGEGVKVAVIDTGIDPKHPAFKSCLKGGLNPRELFNRKPSSNRALEQYRLPQRKNDGTKKNIFDKDYEQWVRNHYKNQPLWVEEIKNGVTKRYTTTIDEIIKDYRKTMKRATDIKNWGKDVYKSSDFYYGHGTASAGCIAAKPIKDTFGNLKLSGIAPNVELYSIINYDTYNDVIAAIDWCIANKVNVINCSLGFYSDPGKEYHEAFKKAKKAGIVVVCSAGNEDFYGGLIGDPRVLFDDRPNNDKVRYPAKYPETIAVGALWSDTVFGKKFPTLYSSRGKEVDFAAPAEFWGTIPRDAGTYGIVGGTSIAAPFVSGCVALIMSAYKKRTGKFPRPDHVYKILKDGCIDLGPKGRDYGTGWGFFTFNKMKFMEIDYRDINQGIKPPTMGA